MALWISTPRWAQYQEIDVDYEIVQAGIDSIFYVVNKSLSTYLPDSDISQINRGDSTLVVDHHFKAVYNKANILWYKTQGLFDPTVGAWVNAYGFGPVAGAEANTNNSSRCSRTIWCCGCTNVTPLSYHSIT